MRLLQVRPENAQLGYSTGLIVQATVIGRLSSEIYCSSVGLMVPYHPFCRLYVILGIYQLSHLHLQ
jgi:hypothetical protein